MELLGCSCSPLFCEGALDEGGVAASFSALVRDRLRSVELGCGAGSCAFAAACAVLREDWGSSLLASAWPLLLAERLIRSSLKSRVHAIDAPFVRSNLQLNCPQCARILRRRRLPKAQREGL